VSKAQTEACAGPSESVHRNPDGSFKSRTIKDLLRYKGSTVALIAKGAGCSERTILRAITGETQSPPARRAIAKTLGLPYSEVWGDRLVELIEKRGVVSGLEMGFDAEVEAIKKRLTALEQAFIARYGEV